MVDTEDAPPRIISARSVRTRGTKLTFGLVQMKVHVVVVGADWRTSEGGRERATGGVHPGSDGRGLEGL